MPTEKPCLSCKAISGEQRISPGPIIFDGTYWMVEHAYPSALMGWLVIVLKRHCTALHELTTEEFQELTQLQEKTVRLLRRETGCAKEYLMCMAEVEGFEHIHVHVVPRQANIPAEYKGSRVFAFLKPDMMEPFPREEVAALCKQLARAWDLV